MYHLAAGAKKTATASGRQGCNTSFLPIPDCEKTAPSTTEGGPKPSQNSFQIYVQGSGGTERFEIESQEDIYQQIKRGWDLNRDQYRLNHKKIYTNKSIQTNTVHERATFLSFLVRREAVRHILPRMDCRLVIEAYSEGRSKNRSLEPLRMG
jgi:hypothetical protein